MDTQHSKVLGIPITHDDYEDIVIWKHSANGICTSKNAYKSLIARRIQNNPVVNVSFAENLKNLTTAAWKSKLLPPRIQTFAWRLSRKALATGERGSTLSRHIEKFCKRCGQVENELHLFFTCEYAKVVWFATF